VFFADLLVDDAGLLATRCTLNRRQTEIHGTHSCHEVSTATGGTTGTTGTAGTGTTKATAAAKKGITAANSTDTEASITSYTYGTTKETACYHCA
jgi:hypothetical protein